MASEYTLDVLVNPISNSSAASTMGAKDGTAYSAAFQKTFSKQQPLGRITGQVSEFQKSMEAANARVVAFGASAGSIYFVKSAFDKLISSTIEVEKSIANINVILGLGQTALKNFSNEMFKAASQTGQTFDTASKVALEFARHGVSATETAKRMTSAMELMRISGLSASDSVNSITAAINAFSKEGLTSADIVNRLTAVDTKFAVSAQDLAKAIQRVGATAEDAGVRFNELLGFVTAAQTTTARGGAVIGNAFKSIFTRLSRPQVLDDLESIGVMTKNAAGQVLPMVTILKNLATQYDHLSYSQKSFITEAVGGVYQVNILKASLADLGNGLSIFDKASIAAASSAGLIDKRMAALNETIASKLNNSTLQITKLFSNFGQISFGDTSKNGLDSFNNALASISDKLEDIKPDDSVGEKIGKTMGQGIAKGIGDILSGPGIQLAAALAMKSLATLGKFTIQSGVEFLGKNAEAEKLKYIQQDITKFVREHAEAQEIVNSETDVAVRLSEAYLRNVSAIAAVQAKMTGITGEAAALSSINVKASPVRNAASGYVPTFAASNEIREARALGADAGVQAKWGRGTIGGHPFVMNNREVEIPNFGRNGDSAVIPMYAGGHVPNFADLAFRKSYDKEFGITRLTGILGSDIVGDIEFSRNKSKGYKEVESFEINENYRGQGYAKQFYKNLGAGQIKGTLLPNFDEKGNAFFPQLSRANGAKSSSVVQFGHMEDEVRLTVAEFKDMVAKNKGNREFWDSNSFDLITNHAKGHVPNFAQIPFISPLVGRLLTNTIRPYGYSTFDKIAQMKNLSGRDIWNAVAHDKPSPFIGNLQKQAMNDEGYESVAVREFAFRKMFGLKPRMGGEEFVSQNSDKSYSFNKGSHPETLVGDLIRAQGVNNRTPNETFMVSDHDVMGRFDAKLSDDKKRASYHDTWDLGLHGHEKVDLKGVFSYLKNAYTYSKNNKTSMFSGMEEISAASEDWMNADNKSSFSNLARKIIHSISSPVTFKGETEVPRYGHGHVPNFALDKVFSVIPQSRITEGDHMDRGTAYEMELLQRLPSLGFSNIKHLAGRSRNIEADFYAKYAGNPWLIDAKHSRNDQSKLSRLSEKERTMRNLLDRMKSNPNAFADLDPNFAAELESMKLGVVLSSLPFSHTIKGYGKAGIDYENLTPFTRKASGYMPNFSSGEDRFDEISRFLAGRVRKPVGNLSKNDYNDALAYLGGDVGQLNSDIKNGGFGGAFPFGRKQTSSIAELLKRKGFSFSALKDAVQREIGAGYSSSQIRIGQDSSLVTSQNPSGVGVYNSTEGSLSQGISLAQQAGIDPKTKGMASGHVPNFADISASILMGMFQGSVTDITQKLDFLSEGYSKEIEQRRALAEEYSKALSMVKAGNTATTPLGTFSAEGNVKAAYFRKYRNDDKNKYILNDESLESETKKYQSYRENISQQQSKLSNIAFKGMFAGPVAGEVAASAAKNLGFENVAKGLEQFSGGITTASQLLSLFPNKLGKALAVGELISSAADGIVAGFTHVGTFEKQLDIQSTALEKMTSSANAVLDSYDKLNQLYNTSTSTMQDYSVQQRRLASSLAELASIPGGSQLVSKIRDAGSDQERRTAVSQAIDVATEQKNLTGSKLEIAKARQENIFGSTFGPSGVFSYSNDADKIGKQQLLRNTALTMQDNAVSQTNDRALTERLTQGTITNQDIESIIATATKSNSSAGGLGLTGNSLSTALDELKYNLKNLQVQGDPEAWKKHQEEVRAVAQQEIALRNRYNQELQNTLSKGAIVSGSILGRAVTTEESRFRGQSFGLYKSSLQTGLAGLTTNDFGMIGLRASQQSQQIQAKSQNEQNLNTLEGAKSINDLVNKAAGEAISSQPKQVVKGVSAASTQSLDMARYMAQRQAAFANNPQDLINAAKNPATFAQTILGGSLSQVTGTGALKASEYNALSGQLETLSKTPDFYQRIEGILTKNYDIASKSKDELERLRVDTIAAYKEASFKELVSALNSSDLLKKGGARELRRKVVRDEYVVAHSTNKIAAGEAAQELLQLTPGSQRDLNNPQIKALYDKVQAGYTAADSYVLNGTNLGRSFNVADTAFAQTYGQENTKAVNGPQVTANLNQNVNGVNVEPLNNAVSKASSDLDNFRNIISSLGGDLEKFKKELDDFIDTHQSKNASTNGANVPQEPTVGQQGFFSRNSGLLTQGAAFVGGSLLTGAGQALGGKLLGAGLSGAGRILPKFSWGEKGLGISFGKAAAAEGASEVAGVTRAADGTFRGAGGKFLSQTSPEAIAARYRGINMSMEDATKISTRLQMAKSVQEATPKNYWKTGTSITSNSAEYYQDIGVIAKPAAAASALGKGLQYAKIGGRALGVAGAAFGAYDTVQNVRQGNYGQAGINAAETALAFAGPIGAIGSATAQFADNRIKKWQSYKDQQGAGELTGAKLDFQIANEKKYKGSEYERRYRDDIANANKTGSISSDEVSYIKNYEKLTGWNSSRKIKDDVVVQQSAKEAATKTEATADANFDKSINQFSTSVSSFQNLKIQDGQLNITLDLSGAKQQIQAMINASIGSIGKVNPPKVA